jgi:hypothetical protein
MSAPLARWHRHRFSEADRLHESHRSQGVGATLQLTAVLEFTKPTERRGPAG